MKKTMHSTRTKPCLSEDWIPTIGSRDLQVSIGLDYAGRRFLLTVESSKDQDTGNQLVRPLDDNVCEEERFPAVRLARSFSDFIERSLGDEERHDLLHDCAENGADHEQAVEHILHALQARVGIEERESNEQTRCGAQHELCHNVAGHPPI